MPKAAAKFTQADVGRALRAANKLGMTVEISPNGTIRVVPIEADKVAKSEPVNYPVRVLFK